MGQHGCKLCKKEINVSIIRHRTDWIDKTLMSLTKLNPLTPRRTQVFPFTEFFFYFKKGSSKKFPMSVAPMSR